MVHQKEIFDEIQQNLLDGMITSSEATFLITLIQYKFNLQKLLSQVENKQPISKPKSPIEEQMNALLMAVKSYQSSPLRKQILNKLIDKFSDMLK